MMVLEQYALEFVKGIGRMFINPLFYWIILLFILMSYKRIKKERQQFGRKVFPPLAESSSTFWISVIGSILISTLAILFGIYFTNEIMLIMLVVVILLSITASSTLLSASYTIGLTFILALTLPFLSIPKFSPYIDFGGVRVEHFITLAFLMGIFLFLEAIILLSRKWQTFPSMTVSKRGVWIGQHHLKKIVFVPFIILLPAAYMPFQIPLFPYFDIGDQPFML